jgi:hypothetical protein
MQQPKVRLFPEFTNHARHCSDDREPLVYAEWPIDPHANEEHHELTIEGSREALVAVHLFAP